jgi:hypothetical protein
MKDTEFRIGNLFNKINRSNAIHLPSNYAFKVCSLESTILCVGYKLDVFNQENLRSINYFDASPIPITDEWLNRFGFKKEKNEWKLFPCFEIQIIIYNEGKYNGIMFYTRTIHTDFVPIYLPTKMNYVHELQNLYFALTGNELEC